MHPYYTSASKERGDMYNLAELVSFQWTMTSKISLSSRNKAQWDLLSLCQIWQKKNQNNHIYIYGEITGLPSGIWIWTITIHCKCSQPVTKTPTCGPLSTSLMLRLHQVRSTMGKANPRLWVEMSCRGCWALCSSSHRANPELQQGTATLTGELCLLSHLWLLWIPATPSFLCVLSSPGALSLPFSGLREMWVCGEEELLSPGTSRGIWATDFISGEEGRAKGRRWQETHRCLLRRC